MRAGPAGGSGSGAAALPARPGPTCAEQVPGGGERGARDTGAFSSGRDGSGGAVFVEGHLRRRCSLSRGRAGQSTAWGRGSGSPGPGSPAALGVWRGTLHGARCLTRPRGAGRTSR